VNQSTIAHLRLYTLACLVGFGLTDPRPSFAEGEPLVPKTQTWRSKMPTPGAERPLKLPVFHRARLKNGLTVLHAGSEDLPLVSLSLVTLGGASADPKGQGGLNSATYNMLEEGTQTLDALQFSDRVANLGASFSTGSGREYGTAEVSGLVQHADAMAFLLASAIRTPALAEKDLKRVREQTLAAILRNRSAASGLAAEIFPELLYGAAHPFGHSPMGQPEAVKRFTEADIRDHHKAVFSPERSALVVVGSTSFGQAIALAQQYFGDWPPQKDGPAPAVPLISPKKRQQLFLVDLPGAPQTQIVVGRPLLDRKKLDEAGWTILNDVYGGTFTSRLNMNLREEKGYTYGARSEVSLRHHVSAFVAQAAVRTDVTGPALVEFVQEMQKLRTSEPTSSEISLAVRGEIRALPAAFERSDVATSAAAQLFVYDLPLDHYRRLPEDLGGVDGARVYAIAKGALDPSVMTILLVGDAKAVQQQVKNLKLGRVTNLQRK
jgi:zinc protease